MNTETDKPLRIRAAWLTLERSNGYCHPRLTFGHVESRDSDGESFRWGDAYYEQPLRSGKLPAGMMLEDFVVTAQGNLAEPGELYGLDYEFRTYRVRPYDVDKMARTFKYVDRALKKAAETNGPARTWQDFALRILVALKVDRLYVKRPDWIDERYRDDVSRYDLPSSMQHGLDYAVHNLWTAAERDAARAKREAV